ncbi:Starch-binding associating with outer membrane [Parapedobacter composti]|uniref:Starch-binding associating with outer membrane n=1 Tax=Parapedobacter composti TaxID=623281 RepID=A0A1I1H7P7_9SPHI|nr:RagB/SusD family nutrient uptake outer membrane protein [Parapedobacter composti]SFC20037.1 Starch-binding associating with outer membrane [Parapedobacter composti]
MKLLKNIMIGLLAVNLLGACSNYLDQVPDDRLTLEDIFKTRTNTERYLAMVYYRLPNEARQRFVATENAGPWTAASDEGKYNWDFNYANNINFSTWNPTNSQVSNIWNNFYRGIRDASYFIEQIDDATEELSPAMKAQYKAEARALRAIFYYNLVRIYGPVIILYDMLPPDAPLADEQIPRSPLDDCIAYITQELEMAAANLSVTPINAEYGRVTRGAALAYRAQALLLAASPLYNGNTDLAGFRNKDGTQLVSQSYDPAKWQIAADAAKEFIDEFVPNTYDLYRENGPSGYDPYLSTRNVMTVDWNKEWIYARANSQNNTQYDRTPYHAGAPTEIRGGGALGVTQKMVDAYFTANGRSIDDPASGYLRDGFSEFQAPFDTRPRRTYNQWVNREPRFYVGVTYNNSLWLNQPNADREYLTVMEFSGNSGRINSDSDVTPTGYIIRKNVHINGNDRGFVYIRLANVYLDYVEALNEYQPDHPDILTYLNLIRERAGIPAYGTEGLPVPSGQSAMRQAIRKERQVELAFENVRYFDIRRWKIAEQEMSGPFYGMNLAANGEAFYERTQLEVRRFNQRDYFFPIPHDETLINLELVQNPGW